MNKFTFYWKTGDREVFDGESAGDALTRAGYSHGALRALDFYATGKCEDYQWDKERRKWVKAAQVKKEAL